MLERLWIVLQNVLRNNADLLRKRCSAHRAFVYDHCRRRAGAVLPGEGLDVRFLTGTDEHGIKIVKAAEEKGFTPQQLADSVVVHFQNLWKDLNISNDDFIRTSQIRHEKRVQAIITRMVAGGDVYMGKYEGWYDEGQEEFVTESVARDNEYKSAINGKPLVRYSEDSYFFSPDRWAPKLIGTSGPILVSSHRRRGETRCCQVGDGRRGPLRQPPGRKAWRLGRAHAQRRPLHRVGLDRRAEQLLHRLGLRKSAWTTTARASGIGPPRCT